MPREIAFVTYETQGIDAGILDSCMAKGVFGDGSMREDDWGDVHARLEKVFSDRRYVRQLSRAKDNWLELPAGKVTAGILAEVRNLAAKRSLEVDFLITEGYPDAAMKARVSPIEVKSGATYTTSSLDKLRPRFQDRIGTEYVLHPKQLKVEGSRVFLPLYMAFCL